MPCGSPNVHSVVTKMVFVRLPLDERSLAPDGTLFVVRRSRSRDVVEELLGADFTGILGSDRASAYSHFPDQRHQFR